MWGTAEGGSSVSPTVIQANNTPPAQIQEENPMKPTKKRSLPLFWRLMALITGFWFLLVTAGTTVTLRYSLMALREQIDDILMSTVATLAHAPGVQRVVAQGYCDEEMSDYLTDVVRNTRDLQYITIADTDSLRLYHVDPDFIGMPFEGGDEQRALDGEIYLSDAVPSNFQPQHRAFHPIFDEGGQVMGFVMASATFESIDKLRDEIFSTYGQLFLLLLILTLIFGGALAVYLGQQLRGVRPEDLIRMYLTQNDTLNALDEGLISFDKTGRVRLVNAAAAKMLGKKEELLVGRQVDDLIRDEQGESLRGRSNFCFQSNRPNILVKSVQLPDGNLWSREVLVMADKSEVRRYAEELGGTKHMINSLRANTHEFLNKLQVISGLLQMGRTEDAQRFIGSIATAHEHVTGPVLQLIRNTGVAALILGKASNMRELDIDFVLMRNTALPERSRCLSTEELVTVVGNLMENAIEAANAIPADELRVVVLQLTEDEKGLYIMVSDTGTGIEPGVLPHIFETGYSTKAATGRGVGMGRVREIVDSHGGTIDVETDPGSGTTFTIILSQKQGGST